ncbi:clostripain-related cysteine peptidase [uncultured Bacteroides sp.]|uniref:clostripain-related cysteine peptidase n=1 Tax=uncultured Bacteroides sp. TaxID=162156 RepID=UPI002AAC052E|nr:clostripain-related cysteine peptidase [uncultured Bacteroides sp.]
MKNLLKPSYLFSLIVLFLLASCHKNDSPKPLKASRTVLAYIVADNSLNSFASLDIDEMVEGYAAVDAENNNLLIYVDDKSTPRLIQVTKDRSGTVIKKTIHTYDEQNSLDVSVMSEVFDRVFERFPADSYGLVLWSHGDGWIQADPAAPSTRWFGQDAGTYMNISALATVLEPAPHFDFILFDACFMQSVEVIYELASYGDYFISSPTEIPGPGAYYVDVVPAMFKEASTKKEEARNVGLAYYNYYNDNYTGVEGSNDNWTMGVSVSVVESDKLASLAVATKTLLPQYISNGATVATSGILCYDPYRDQNYYDMNGLAYSLAGEGSVYEAWKAAYEEAVVWAETTPSNYCTSSFGSGKMTSMAGFSGLSIHIPEGAFSSSVNTFYRTLGWYTAGGWSDTGW